MNNSEKRILCVGMCVLDIITVCEVFPTEDTDKRCIEGYWQRGGNASNNCTVLQNFGIQCEFLGMLSKSPAFTFLIDDCHQRQILIDNCPTTKQDPTFSTVILSKEKGTRTIIHNNQKFPILTYEDFKKIELKNYRWIHFEARNPDETLQMIEYIKNFNDRVTAKDEGAARIKISVEFEKVFVENLILAKWANYIFLGKDLAISLGWHDVQKAVFGLRKLLIENKWQMDCHNSAIICTWGANGASCLDTNDNYTFIPPQPPQHIVDSLGAGDTFCAATIFALIEQNKNLPEAVAFGNQCAGFKLGFRGYDSICNVLKQS